MAIAACLLTGRAHAAPAEDEAAALMKRGIELRKGGDDQGALPLFQQAYRLHPSPLSAVQLGLAEYALGRWTEAEHHLSEGLKHPEHTWIKKNRDTIAESLWKVKQNVGSLDVTGEPAGAEVLINGRPVGKLPLAEPVRVNVGNADVELRAVGFRPGARTVTVVGGHHQSVVLRLEPAAATSTGGRGPITGPVAAAASPPPDRPPPSGRGWMRPTKYVASAAALVAFGVATYGYVRHEKKVDEFASKKDDVTGEQRCLNVGNEILDHQGGMARKDCFDLRTAYTDARNLMVGALVTGGLLAAGAATLWILDARRGSAAQEAQTAHLTCAPNLLRPGLACALRF
jgi:hypothetical protein